MILAKFKAVFWNSHERRPRSVWRVMLELVAAIFLLSLLQSQIEFVAVPKVSEIGTSDGLSKASKMAFQNGLVMMVLFGTALLAARFMDRRRLASLGLCLDRRWLLDCFGGLVLGAIMVSTVFGVFLICGFTESRFNPLNVKALIRLQIGWVATIAMVAIAEEVMFRGYQFKNLCEGMSKLQPVWGIAIATLVSSTVFGVVHGANPGASLFACLSILCAGVMLCVGRIYTGSLAAPIGLHFAWNYGLAGVVGLPVSGITLPGAILESTTAENLWTGGDFGPEASPLVILAMLVGTAAFIWWPIRRKPLSENANELCALVPRGNGQERHPQSGEPDRS